MATLNPSRVQRDLDEMRARIAEIERGVSGESVAAAVAKSIGAERLRERAAQLRAGAAAAAPRTEAQPIRLIQSPKQIANQLNAAISYAKLLCRPISERRKFVALHGSGGKDLYDQELAKLRAEAKERGTAYLNPASVVLRRLQAKLPNGGAVKLVGGRGVRLTGAIQKFMSGGTRMVRGFASTSDLDRQGDIVVPSGMQVKLPIPLLWAHNHSLPIGSVRNAEVKPGGIWIEASMVEGVSQAEEAWKLVEGGAVDSFSIGFRVLDYEPIASGMRVTSWDLYEVSLVSVPANPNAKLRR